jgi:hypothetical protein
MRYPGKFSGLRKPEGLLKPDLTHPFARNLRNCIIDQHLNDIGSPSAPSSLPEGTRGEDQFGSFYSKDVSTADTWTYSGNRNKILGAQPRTYMIILRRIGSYNSARIINFGGTSNGERFTVRYDTGNALRFEIQGTGYTSSLIVGDTDVSVIAIRSTTDQLGGGSLFLNGVKEDTSGGTTVIATTNDDWALMTQSGMTDNVYALFGWDRALSDAEIQSLTRNPYQFLRRPYIYAPLVAGSGVDVGPTTGLSKSNSLDPSISIAVEVDVSPLARSSVSLSLDPSIFLVAEVAVLPGVNSSASRSLDPILAIAAQADILPSVNSSSSRSLDPTISLSVPVSVSPSSSRSVSDSLNPNLSLAANVEISSSVDRSVSNAINPDVQIGGDISVLPQVSRSASNSLDPNILIAANVAVGPVVTLSASRPLDPLVQLSAPISVAPNSIRSISVANDPIIDIDETIVVFPVVRRSVSNARLPLVQVGQAVRIDQFTVNYRESDSNAVYRSDDKLLSYADSYASAKYGE